MLKIRIIRHNARISDPGLVLGDADDSVDELDDDDQLSDRLQRSCVRLHRVQVHAAPILQVWASSRLYLLQGMIQYNS